jgi:5-formyltetrahydrofolate cyclo-ligase
MPDRIVDACFSPDPSAMANGPSWSYEYGIACPLLEGFSPMSSPSPTPTPPAAPLSPMQEKKKELREQAHAARNALPNKDELSQKICETFVALPEYKAAKTVLFYVDVRSEVRTRNYLATALTHGKKIVVPWCNAEGELELFHLASMEELAIGMYKILEPRPEIRLLPDKQVDVKVLDLVMVPGVAFDRRGGRMGHGKGYYDKLLEHARPDTPLVALAFECQMFPEIPVAEHDVFMDKIITESAVYEGRGRRS